MYEQAQAPAGGTLLTPRVKLFVGALVLMAALGYLIYAAFPGNAHYYLTISELAERDTSSARTVRVAGKLVPDTFAREADGTTVRFTLTDGQQELDARFGGVVPDLFFNPHSDVVLQGRLGDDGVFLADEVIVKCPTKYQAVEYEVPPDARPSS